jgi:hypothetical protein
MDGGLGWNNPALELYHEARATFPNRKVDCIISIGTGTVPGNELPRPKWWQTKIAVHLIPTIVKIATECEKVHVEMSRRFSDEPNTYFRFDVDGMGDIGLEEWKSIAAIRSKTISYLSKPDVNVKVDAAVDTLYSSLSTLESEAAG